MENNTLYELKSGENTVQSHRKANFMIIDELLKIKSGKSKQATLKNNL